MENKKARDIGLREPQPSNHTGEPEFCPLAIVLYYIFCLMSNHFLFFI